jgi:hypothetical protein
VRLFRRKKHGVNVKDVAAFFRELVSLSKEFLTRPVRVHFVADFASPDPRGASDVEAFLPFLRMVLFDAAQNTPANPDTSLYIHTAAEGSAAEIAAAIAGELRGAGDEFFIISWGKPGIQKELIRAFSGLDEAARKRVTLFHLPLGRGNARAETKTLAAAVKILLRGERIAAGETGLRIVQEKI